MDEMRARFETQVLPHLDAAYRYARRLARSPGDADDLVQDAVLRAFRGFSGLRGANVKAWLLTIVRNCHFTAYKLQARRPSAGSADSIDSSHEQSIAAPDQDPERISMHQDDERTLEKLLSSLSEEHREVLSLREIDDLSYSEIAVITNLPIGTVMSRLARARSALRSQWSKMEPGESHVVPRV